MLPRATLTRAAREVTRGRPSGRSAEIQRLIGRSLRAVVDRGLPRPQRPHGPRRPRADGGTRTAAVTGAYVALAQAFARMLLTGDVAT